MAAQREEWGTGGFRALVFDLWDTLTVPSVGTRDRLVAEVGAILGADPSGFAEAYAATFPERARGELGDLQSTLRRVCSMVGATPHDAAVDAAAARRLEVTAELMQFRDDALRTVQRFRDAGWLIGLVTDSSCDSEAVWATTPLSSLVDGAVFSCAEGVSKPAPKLFEVALRRLGVDAPQCVYVADGRAGELATAAALGMRAIRLAIDVHYPDSEVWAGETVQRLDDLPSLLVESGVST